MRRILRHGRGIKYQQLGNVKLRSINITLNSDERWSKKKPVLLKQCKIYPLFAKRRPMAKIRSFFHRLFTRMRSSYISEWVPRGQNNHSTSAVTSPFLNISQKLALKPIPGVQYQNPTLKYIFKQSIFVYHWLFGIKNVP